VLLLFNVTIIRFIINPVELWKSKKYGLLITLYFYNQQPKQKEKQNTKPEQLGF